MRQTVKQLLASAPEGYSARKVVAPNTLKYSFEDGTIIYQFHDTHIINQAPNGSLVLDSGGWRTCTTKDRLNRFLPAGLHVYQQDRIWWLCWGREPHQRKYFEDGMVVDPANLYTQVAEEPSATLEHEKALNKKVSRYCTALAKHIREHGLPQPDNGDCFMCSSILPDTDVEHLLSHLDEKYFVGSLIARAVQQRGFGNPDVVWAMATDRKEPTLIVPAVRRYIRARLGLSR